MSSVDTRLKDIWKHSQTYHRTRDPLWLSMIDACTFSEDPVEAAAAAKFLSKHKKVTYESSTG